MKRLVFTGPEACKFKYPREGTVVGGCFEWLGTGISRRGSIERRAGSMTDLKEKGRRARAEDLRRFAESLLERAGLGSSEAGRVVDNLLDADLRASTPTGWASSTSWWAGSRRVESTRTPGPSRLRPGAVLLLDADRGPGQVAGHRAMTLACSRARELGAGVVGVFRSNHFGTAGYYARMAADQGLIGLAVSNTGACMAPWGGSTPTYGTNPLAIAVPTGGEFPS